MTPYALCAVCVLLVAAPVGAEPAYEVTCSTVDAKGRPANIATVHMKPDPCLAQMEAAMRAMEPFTIQFDKKSQTAQSIIRNFEEFKWATAQWDAAKKQCWKEKP